MRHSSYSFPSPRSSALPLCSGWDLRTYLSHTHSSPLASQPRCTYVRHTNHPSRLTIVGIVRCVTFWRTRSSANPTINLMPLAYWSCAETLVAIMCACLPDSRFFFSRLVPKFYKTLASSIHHKSSDRASSATPGSYRTLSNISGSKGSSKKPLQKESKRPRKEGDEEEMTGFSATKSTVTASTVSL